jgi:dihydroorotate dehydrogenase
MDETHIEVMGMRLSGRMGMAAGLDRYGEIAHRAGRLGLAFVETGTVTPRPEPGRNRGIDVLVASLLRRGWHRPHLRVQRCRLGISIARNSSTPLAEAARDYAFCLHKGWPFADYFTLNLGSVLIAARETPHILPVLLAKVKEAQLRLAARTGRQVPIAVKAVLHEDTMEELARLVGHLAALEFEGLLAATPDPEPGETTVRPGVLIGELARLKSARMAILSVGGIRSADEACARIEAGASLLQMHRGLIDIGPGLAWSIRCQLAERTGRSFARPLSG